MNIKCLKPQDVIKLSSSISLILIEKFDENELNTIKNLLCQVSNNISCYNTQKIIYNKKNSKD